MATIAAVFLVINYELVRPYELPDDPAWEFTANGKNAHILAQDEHSFGEESRVLVQWQNGTRSWLKVSTLPHYWKLHSVDTKAKALMASETLEENILGKTLAEIEDEYAYAQEIKNLKEIDFPIKVLTKGEATSSDHVTVFFTDTVATAVKFVKEDDAKAIRYSQVPLAYSFIEKGVKAGQRDGFVSNLKDVAKEKKRGLLPMLGRLVMGLLKILAALIIIFLVFSVPFLVALPLLMLIREIGDSFYVKLLSLIVILAFMLGYIILLLLFEGTQLWLPIATVLVSGFLTLNVD